MMACLVFLLLVVTCYHALLIEGKQCLNNRPIIGVLGQRITSKTLQRIYPFTKRKSYLHAGYVKWIESSGARVVLIKDGMQKSKLVKLLDSINGVVFPGGASSLETSLYAKTGRMIFDYAVEAKKKGKQFPILGICLGFQLLTKLVAGRNLLQRTDAKRISMTMEYTKQATKSEMFKDLGKRMLGLTKRKTLAFNSHRWGIYPRVFKRNYRLRNFFEILTTSKDRKGLEFVAAMEAKNYPIFGVQWHPEKPSFEWNKILNMDQTYESILFSQKMGNFFVNQARGNCNSFNSRKEERGSLVYNYYPLYTGDIMSIEQLYIF